MGSAIPLHYIADRGCGGGGMQLAGVVEMEGCGDTQLDGLLRCRGIVTHGLHSVSHPFLHVGRNSDERCPRGIRIFYPIPFDQIESRR